MHVPAVPKTIVQVNGAEHVPQLAIPHPSFIVPQSNPCARQVVVGVHVPHVPPLQTCPPGHVAPHEIVPPHPSLAVPQFNPAGQDDAGTHGPELPPVTSA